MIKILRAQAARALLPLTGALALGAGLAACGGGGGGGAASSGPLPAASPAAMPTTPMPATPSPSAAIVSGVVVDLASNAPLSGIAIATSSYAIGAPYTVVATTASDGSFSFSTMPGQYELRIGSELAAPPDNRATLHMGLTFAPGKNTVTMPVPSPYPDVTYTASQIAGSLRLATLNTQQLSCLSGANQGRGNLGLPLLVPDEVLVESSMAVLQEEVAQGTDQPVPLFGLSGFPISYVGVAPTTPLGATTSASFPSCQTWSGSTYSYITGNPPYQYATNSMQAYYGASFQPIAYGIQMWLGDPRSRTNVLPPSQVLLLPR